MSAASQYIDPQVLNAMEPELRSRIERQFQLGVRQLEAKLASDRLTKAKLDLANAERLHGLSGMSGPLIKSDLIR